MKIRNSTKAIIVSNRKLLVTSLRDASGFFYLLPGGGQEPGESLSNCLIREIIEETGYTVEVKDMMFVRECFIDEGIHRVEFVFAADILSHDKIIEMDANQLGIEWIDIDNLINEPLFPEEYRTLIRAYSMGHKEQVYLGEIK
jgi:8-oxo-dGTP pyrophosphatase MutT (NUDIX family)